MSYVKIKNSNGETIEMHKNIEETERVLENINEDYHIANFI